jgi:hypothetical protein
MKQGGGMRVLFLAAVVGAGLFFGYRLWIEPQTAKLPVPEKMPLFSVDYVYSLKPVNPVTFSFGSEKVTTANLGERIAKDMREIKQAGFTGVKFNFKFRTDNYMTERMTLKAAETGLYPIGILTGHNYKPKERAFTDNEMAEWEMFVRDEVGKNRNRIYFWEVWNEPNMTELPFRYGTPAEYLDLLIRTQKIIKEENSQAKIIVNADYTDRESEAFTNEFLKLGGANYLDFLSFHPYNALDPRGRENLAQTVDREKALAAKYHKSLVMSEIGVPDSDSDEKRQAEIASKLFKTAIDNQIPIVWFYWSDQRLPMADGKTGWGLVRGDGSAKPALKIAQ